MAKARWQSICKDCAGAIDSLVELLQGRFSKGVMERVCRQKTGLFPSPDEIKLSCSCPDWADMCKHVAAVLYGIGARLDQQPELLFRLHKVDEKELIAGGRKGASPRPGRRRLPARSSAAKTFPLSLDWTWLKTLAPMPGSLARQPWNRSVRKHEPARRSRQCPAGKVRAEGIAGTRKTGNCGPGTARLEKKMMPS